jgi:hypothetical protein
MGSVSNFVRVAAVWLAISGWIAFSIPTFVHHRGFTKAVAEYAKNPSSENQRLLNIEQDKLRKDFIRTQFAVWAALFGAGLAVYGVGVTVVHALQRRKRPGLTI